jgi:uncharacterized protein
MTPNEKALIEDLFSRLRANPVGQRDAEAEQLITSQMASTPGAAYALAQTVLVQDQALRQAHDQLKAAEAAAQQRPAPPAQGGGFFERFGLGGGSPAPAPVQQQQAPDQGGGAGGGFMRGALQTAAGVAGGALLFEGVRSLFGGHANAAGFGGPWGSGGSGFLDNAPVINETIINDYSGSGGDTFLPNDDPSFDDGGYDGDSGDNL